jgi:hypothetical protein
MQYEWTLATGEDVNEIVALSKEFFENEIDELFTPEPPVLSRNLLFAVTSQFYLPGTELVSVCRSVPDRKLLAYNWAKSNDRAVWSDDPMVSVRMVHVNLTLPARIRIRIINDMMDQWEQFAYFTRHYIICSTTMRRDQDAFLKLHARRGYDIRGSYAYKNLNTTTTQAQPANSVDPD